MKNKRKNMPREVWIFGIVVSLIGYGALLGHAVASLVPISFFLLIILIIIVSELWFVHEYERAIREEYIL